MADGSVLRNPLYRNWVRAALGLKYLQQGLAGYVNNLSDQRHQSHLYSYRKATGSPAHSCNECTADNLLPEHPRKTCIQKYRSKCFCNSPGGRRPCPNNFCSRFYDLIVLDHDERNPVWTNTDPSCWYKDHWSFARCFLATAGYHDKLSAAKTDAAGLLSILINNVEFRTSLDIVSNFEEVRNSRNDIIHSSTFEVENEKLSKILNQFVSILNDKKSLINDVDAQQACVKLEKLKTDDIYINSVEAEELHKKALASIAEKKEEVLAEIDRMTLESIDRIANTVQQNTRFVSNAVTQTITDTNITQTNEVSASIFDKEKQELQRYLVNLYGEGFLKTDLSPLLPGEEVDVDKLFVPLKMLKRIGNNREAKPVRTLDDIFFCENEHAQCIYVSGDAGIGKTTLCRKLISEWCKVHSTLSNNDTVEEGNRNDGMEIKTETIPTNENLNSHRIYSFSEDVRKRRQSDRDEKNYSQLDSDDNHCENNRIYPFSEDVLMRKYSASDEGYSFLLDSDDSLSDYSSDESNSDVNILVAGSKDVYSQVKSKANFLRESALKQFYYLFFISLRDTYKERSIEEMVCSQLLRKKPSQEIFRAVLDKEPGRCLFILDGLDEWVPPVPLPTHPTVTPGIPISSGDGDFTKLFTSRPWKVELFRPKLSDNDLDITIHGIEKQSMECLVKNVFDKLTSNKDDVELNTLIFLHKLKSRNIECLGSVPLLLKLLVCLSERDGTLEDSQSGIYNSVVNKLCSLAVERNQTNGMFESLVSRVEIQNCVLPSCLKKYAVCCRFSSLIYSLGRLSFETIFHNNSETALVFKDEDLTRYGMTKAEIELSMMVGLLSQKKVIGNFQMYPVRCVSFIHKTFQEYFASIYIAMSYENDSTVVKRIRERCTSIETILDISKVLSFVKDIDALILSRVTGDIKFSYEQLRTVWMTVEMNRLTLSRNINSGIKMVVELFLSSEIRSILIKDSDFGIHTLRFPTAMKNLESITFDSVEMTHCTFREIIESIPNTTSGVSLIFRNVAFKTFNQNEEWQVTIMSNYLRSIEFHFMNMGDLCLRFPDKLTILEYVKFHMVTMNEKELVELLKSIPNTSQDFTLIFYDITLRTTLSGDSNYLTKCFDLKYFPCKTKHSRRVAFRCSGNTVNCKSIILDELYGKEDVFLMYLEGKIKNHSNTTVIRIFSSEDSEQTDMHTVAPELTVIILGYSKQQFIQSFQLTNITLSEEDFCEILSNSNLKRLNLIHLDRIDIGERSSQKKCIHIGCDSLIIKKMNLSCVQISFTKQPSFVCLADITLAVQDFFKLLLCVKEKIDVIVDVDNLSLIKRLNSLSIAKCGVIQKLKSDSRKKYYMQHTVMRENDLYSLLECFVQKNEIELDNTIVKADSSDLKHLEFSNLQNVPISHKIVTYFRFPNLKVYLRNICLTNKTFRKLLQDKFVMLLFMDEITITNTDSSVAIVLPSKNMKELTIERTDLKDISIISTKNFYRIARFSYVTVTENAFCSLLEHKTDCASLMLYNITITNTSVEERPVQCLRTEHISIEQTNLANILLNFMDCVNVLEFRNSIMSENAFCALLENRSNNRWVVLNDITLTRMSVSNRQIICKNIQNLQIIRMDLSNRELKFHFDNYRRLSEFSGMILEDIKMTENSLKNMLKSLPEDRFDVTLTLQDDSTALPSSDDSDSDKHTECKTIKRMTVLRRYRYRYW